jgi:hypothetical protein
MSVTPTPNSKKVSFIIKKATEVEGAGLKIIRFRNRAMVLLTSPYSHYVPLRRELFDNLIYPILGGVSRSTMSDVFAYISNTALDMSEAEGRIGFGLGEDAKVWDMNKLVWRESAIETVWRSPYAPVKGSERIQFILDLAGGDEGVYDDILQSLAPLVMNRKPDGVIWWVGDGANGKSTLMDALYRIFPGQLASITVKRLVDGRDTPSLNGILGNIVKESSEGRVEDTEIYKAVGTHENFRVHRFHSQDDIEVMGNVHHIFSANLIPTFNDKGYAARRRTFIIPFREHFESNPAFEATVFTPELFGRLIAEICKYAAKLGARKHRYVWSGVTVEAKADYDSEASNAEEYVKGLRQQGVVAFDSFAPMRIDYENWCAEHGFVPLGLTNLRRAFKAHRFERTSRYVGEFARQNIYKLPETAGAELLPMGMSRQGMYTAPGFEGAYLEPVVEEPAKPEQKSLLDGNW